MYIPKHVFPKQVLPASFCLILSIYPPSSIAARCDFRLLMIVIFNYLPGPSSLLVVLNRQKTISCPDVGISQIVGVLIYRRLSLGLDSFSSTVNNGQVTPVSSQDSGGAGELKK